MQLPLCPWRESACLTTSETMMTSMKMGASVQAILLAQLAIFRTRILPQRKIFRSCS